MLTWERTLQEIGNDENFAIPFWKSKTQCEPAICSEELLGVTKQVGGTVQGKYFDNWCVICTSEQTHFSPKMCDPMNKKTGLERITEKEMEGKMYLLRQTTQSSLFIISLWIVFMRNVLASSTRTLRFLQPTMHPSDTTKITSLYHFILCYRQYTYTHQQMFINKKSFEFGYDYDNIMSTRMVSIH
ncbi:unnamed protein product [Porites lobata]|uniref:Uncharacterized protein n=1 Tax=Porites lobata TaxID=104759 RepID=A0ABN8RUR9_9CNID|nr:unnamed protein product [Porites lobata]